jgi:hypothetical protein
MIRWRWQLLDEALKRLIVNETEAIRQFLGGGDPQASALLHNFDELTRLVEITRPTTVQPGRPPAQNADIEAALLQVDTIDVCDLEFSPCRRLDLLDDFENVCRMVQSSFNIGRPL